MPSISIGESLGLKKYVTNEIPTRNKIIKATTIINKKENLVTKPFESEND